MAQTPYLEMNAEQIQHNIRNIRRAFPSVEVLFALKCNPHPMVVRCLQDLTIGFEIASNTELELVLNSGVAPTQIACFHPIKSPKFLESLRRAGVRRMAADSFQEVAQIATYCPEAELFVRLDTGTRHSRLLLNKKFGCSHEHAMKLFRYALELDLDVRGITIHVGSQCEDISDWKLAADACYRLLDDALQAGLPLEVFSLGGGLPVSYGEPTLEWSTIGQTMLSAIRSADPTGRLRFMMEPGRAIVSSAGKLHSTVIAIAEREDGTWLYLDAGIYHGLSEKLAVHGGFVLPVETESPLRPSKTYKLAGPTCDSTDTLPGWYTLPEVRVGDRITFLCAGSYTTSIATGFNGFNAPVTRWLTHENCVPG